MIASRPCQGHAQPVVETLQQFLCQHRIAVDQAAHVRQGIEQEMRLDLRLQQFQVRFDLTSLALALDELPLLDFRLDALGKQHG